MIFNLVISYFKCWALFLDSALCLNYRASVRVPVSLFGPGGGSAGPFWQFGNLTIWVGLGWLGLVWLWFAWVGLARVGLGWVRLVLVEFG